MLERESFNGAKMVTLEIIRKDMKKLLDVDESLNYVDVLADTLEEAFFMR